MSNSLEVSGVNVNASGVRIGHTDVQDTGLDASTSSGISTKPSVSLVNIGFSGTPKAPQAGLGLNFALFNFGNNFGLGSGASVDGSEDSGRGGQSKPGLPSCAPNDDDNGGGNSSELLEEMENTQGIGCWIRWSDK
ncbi:unnamed protein product [Didymodactylos carnosus]|uniref:Uncharacterized protein n=1 Tax=Didymodactylos carnosus TaxID=1234261 RepID=A0A8S2T4B9_9BILA|nr:unnamed protein product [Didymodactylos carnosus]CAF4268778.1 unnamed protein product [Didymodactylos carnosus]